MIASRFKTTRVFIRDSPPTFDVSGIMLRAYSVIRGMPLTRACAIKQLPRASYQCNEELAIAMKSEDMLAKCTDSKSALSLAYSYLYLLIC